MFNDKNYIQIDGLSIDSYLAPLMAELPIHAIELKLAMLNTYVDDSFAIFNSQEKALLKGLPDVMQKRYYLQHTHTFTQQFNLFRILVFIQLTPCSFH